MVTRLQVEGAPFWSTHPLGCVVNTVSVRKLFCPGRLLLSWNEAGVLVGRVTVKVWPSPVSLLMNMRFTVSPWEMVMNGGKNLSFPFGEDTPNGRVHSMVMLRVEGL